ncbi:MAG: hypothetical protein LBE02_09410 [Spirochaetaceae bacterium]|jgi:NAD(P)-dependent dehydrogenase (short-subunit alcohol dehydrogenase family)|nr:hypothetical protein [Spirochaetaceae bacterium]
MSKGLLIAGNPSSLFSALCTEAAKRTEKYAAACIPRGGEAASLDAPAKQITLDWNPGSPISTRAIIISAANKLKSIDNVILACVPPVYRRTVEGLSQAELDRFTDNNIKGWFFLVRELAVVFTARGSGALSFVLSEVQGGSRDEAPDLLGPSAAAAFRSFAQGVLNSSLNESCSIMGFSSCEPGEESAFAAYVFKVLEEGRRNSGKWHKHGKFGIFGR